MGGLSTGATVWYSKQWHSGTVAPAYLLSTAAGSLETSVAW